jgi:hypothetical protein
MLQSLESILLGFWTFFLFWAYKLTMITRIEKIMISAQRLLIGIFWSMANLEVGGSKLKTLRNHLATIYSYSVMAFPFVS